MRQKRKDMIFFSINKKMKEVKSVVELEQMKQQLLAYKTPLEEVRDSL